MKPIARIVSCLALLFLSGGVCGYATSRHLGAGRPAWILAPQWAERWLQQSMARDFAVLQPTPEQEAQLRPIYQKLLADFNAIQAASARQVNDAFQRHGREVWGQLTPAQREAFQQLNQQRLNRAACKSTARPSSSP